MKTPWWKDSLLTAAELVARNVYWRMPWLRAWVKRRRAVRRPTPQVADRQELKDYLRHIGVTKGSLVMAHTSTFALMLTEAPSARGGMADAFATASHLVDDLLELVGDTGTLVMPTHAAYQAETWNKCDSKLSAPIRYDPAKTACSVGLANELFRRRKGVQRSLHPFNMVAAYGPLAEELLRDNLNDTKPLPHGIHSAYYRFCQRHGLVISIGIPLGDCMTLLHTAEDVRAEDFPIQNFLKERRYLVRIDGEDREVVVRHQRPEYSLYCRCHHKSIRDLAGEGILHEAAVGSAHVGWARAKEVFDYLMRRTEKRPYPFYCTWLVRKRP